MRPLLSIVLALVLAVPALAADTYRWVDADGHVHYSDQPHEGAEKVQLPDLPTYDQPKVPPQTRQPQASEQDESPGYRSVQVTSPAAESTFWVGTGPLTLSAAATPALHEGDRYQFYLDGAPVGDGPSSAASVTVDQIFRGEHTVRATVVDSSGQELATSQPVTFYVRQHTVPKPPSKR